MGSLGLPASIDEDNCRYGEDNHDEPLLDLLHHYIVILDQVYFMLIYKAANVLFLHITTLLLQRFVYDSLSRGSSRQ